MKRVLLDWLRCPESGSPLALDVTLEDGDEIIEGTLRSPEGREYPIVRAIPRFVPSDDYSGTFSFEWKRHSVTLLDSHGSHGRSEHDFADRVSFPLESLDGKLVLDAGCGMGRFAEVSLKHGAVLVGIDLSYAIDEAFGNLSKYPNAHFIQADVFKPPFAPEIFDVVYSFGVLHHTPSTERAVKSIGPLLKIGGELAVFLYSGYNKAVVHSNRFWRSITTRLPLRLLYYLCFIAVPLYYIYRLPGLTQIGRMIFEISMEKDWRWRVLDTFDWYSPKYQWRHNHWEVYDWFCDAGVTEVKIHPSEVTMSGTKRRPSA